MTSIHKVNAFVITSVLVLSVLPLFAHADRRTSSSSGPVGHQTTTTGSSTGNNTAGPNAGTPSDNSNNNPSTNSNPDTNAADFSDWEGQDGSGFFDNNDNGTPDAGTVDPTLPGSSAGNVGGAGNTGTGGNGNNGAATGGDGGNGGSSSDGGSVVSGNVVGGAHVLNMLNTVIIRLHH